jgi:hypothetical protein
MLSQLLDTAVRLALFLPIVVAVFALALPIGADRG